ncbi:MAG: hypothetical protein Q9184_005842 [Pyrenodesmia sp. 2 TL-2023]
MASSTETPADRIPWALRIEYLANNNPWPSTETPVYEHSWLLTDGTPADNTPCLLSETAVYNTPWPSSQTPVYGLKRSLKCGNPAMAKMTPGSIYYLPPRHQLSLSRQHVTGNLSPGIFDHPVLILRTCARTSTVEFLIMTTLGGRSLKKDTNSPSRRAHLVPLFPNDPHPDNGSLVHLQNEWSLPKKGYIGTDKRVTMPCDILKPLFDQTGRQFQLRDEDFRDIDVMAARSPRYFSRPESPCSTRSRSSSISSISSHSSPPSCAELAGQRIQYSKRKILSLRSAAISKPSLLASLKTEDFDLLKVIHKDTTDAARGGIPQYNLPTLTTTSTSNPQHSLRSPHPDTQSGAHPLFWAPAEETASTPDPWREIAAERERIAKVLLKKKDILQGIQVDCDSFRQLAIDKPASCLQLAEADARLPTP